MSKATGEWNIIFSMFYDFKSLISLICMILRLTKKVGASADTFRIVDSPTTENISGTTKNEGVNRKALDKVNFNIIIVSLLFLFTFLYFIHCNVCSYGPYMLLATQCQFHF